MAACRVAVAVGRVALSIARVDVARTIVNVGGGVVIQRDRIGAGEHLRDAARVVLSRCRVKIKRCTVRAAQNPAARAVVHCGLRVKVCRPCAPTTHDLAAAVVCVGRPVEVQRVWAGAPKNGFALQRACGRVPDFAEPDRRGLRSTAALQHCVCNRNGQRVVARFAVRRLSYCAARLASIFLVTVLKPSTVAMVRAGHGKRHAK